MKRKRNIVNSLYIQPEELERLVIKRQAQYDEIIKNECLFEEIDTDDADIIITAYGITARIAKNAKKMARDAGIKVGIIRPITLWPFPSAAIEKAAARGKPFLCVEMSMGQMVEDVRLAVNGKARVEFFGRTGGVVPEPSEIFAEIKKITGGAL